MEKPIGKKLAGSWFLIVNSKFLQLEDSGSGCVSRTCCYFSLSLLINPCKANNGDINCSPACVPSLVSVAGVCARNWLAEGGEFCIFVSKLPLRGIQVSVYILLGCGLSFYKEGLVL